MIRTVIMMLPVALLAGNLESLVHQSFSSEPINIAKANLQSVEIENEAINKSYMPHVYVGGNANVIDKESFGYARQSTQAYVKATGTVYDGGKKWAYPRQYQSKIEAQPTSFDDD